MPPKRTAPKKKKTTAPTKKTTAPKKKKTTAPKKKKTTAPKKKKTTAPKTKTAQKKKTAAKKKRTVAERLRSVSEQLTGGKRRNEKRAKKKHSAARKKNGKTDKTVSMIAGPDTAVLVYATQHLLDRLNAETESGTSGIHTPPSNMLLTMADVNRVASTFDVTLPVVAPQDYDRVTFLDSAHEDIVHEHFFEDFHTEASGGIIEVAVTGSGSDMWWVVSHDLVLWLEGELFYFRTKRRR